MNLLVFNCGSSSLTYKLYHADQSDQLTAIAQGKAHHVGAKSQESAYLIHQIKQQTNRHTIDLPNHAIAASEVLVALTKADVQIDAIGHRFVHGGTQFSKTTKITEENLALLEACTPLAPIHNPNSLSVIDLCQERMGSIPQFVAFDTAFHAQMPEFAYRYALPTDLSDKLKFRKYGFHGLSYQYITGETARYLQVSLDKLRLIACHLGTGGSSVAAIEAGHSLDTSMGYSPLPGLMMSTRSGDLDPSIPLALIEEAGYTSQDVNRILNKESGLLGVSGFTSDLFEIVEQAETGNQSARLAFEMYTHRLKFYIGGYLGILNGCDALVFTDDIGQRCWQVREAACSGFAGFGIQLDPAVNRKADGSVLQVVSAPGSKIMVLVVPTDEEIVIAQDGLRLLR